MYFYNPEPSIDSVGAGAAATIETKQQSFPLDALGTESKAIEWSNAVEGDLSPVTIKNGSQPRNRQYVNANAANGADYEITNRNGEYSTLLFHVTNISLFACINWTLIIKWQINFIHAQAQLQTV